MEERKENNDRDKMPKDNPFRVPDGYFENLGTEIEKKIRISEKGSSKKVRLWDITRRQLALAAGIVLFVIISTSVMHFILDRGPDNSFHGGQYAALIEEGLDDYDTELLIDEYVDIIEAEETPAAIDNENDIPEEEIIDFLIYENIEMNMILNEL